MKVFYSCSSCRDGFPVTPSGRLSKVYRLTPLLANNRVTSAFFPSRDSLSIRTKLRRRVTTSGGIPKFSKISGWDFLTGVYGASIHPGV